MTLPPRGNQVFGWEDPFDVWRRGQHPRNVRLVYDAMVAVTERRWHREYDWYPDPTTPGRVNMYVSPAILVTMQFFPGGFVWMVYIGFP